MNIRTGIGYDVHQIKQHRPLILGGVKIADEFGLDGHSDADVLSHAIADALLGAAGERDIGFWFSPDQEKFKDISSQKILTKILGILNQKKFSIINIDSVIVTEKPKIAPHIETIKTNLAKTLQIEPDRIGVKATTSELMGFIGRHEGMASYASALLEKL